jgi:hypothetical protein
MDHTRYLAYKSAVRALGRLPEGVLDDHERERLRDNAEPLRRDAGLALSLLVGQRRWDDLTADVMWHAISDCGPAAADATVRRVRAMTFAGAL